MRTDPNDAGARLAVRGAGALSDAELLALLLERPPRDADALLRRFGGLPQLARAGSRELADRGGVPPPTVERVRAALELGRRAIDTPLRRGDPIRAPAHVEARLRGRLAALEHEELHVLGLDVRSRLVLHFVAAVGATNLVCVTPREVFRPLVREGAQSAIVIHNHPSGSPEPSDDDATLTDTLAEAGATVGIALLDHVVIARGGSYSFAEAGRLAKMG